MEKMRINVTARKIGHFDNAMDLASVEGLEGMEVHNIKPQKLDSPFPLATVRSLTGSVVTSAAVQGFETIFEGTPVFLSIPGVNVITLWSTGNDIMVSLVRRTHIRSTCPEFDCAFRPL